MESVRMKIADLRPHPQQQQIYGDLNPTEFQGLKVDIEKLGQRHPIEVTEDGTIIDGHQRVRALQELGHAEVEVIVRKGLSDEERDEMFLYGNLVRRQLDPIAKARVLSEIARRAAQKKGFADDITHLPNFREYLAERLGGGISGRTVGRYLQLLRLPRPVQDAVSNGQLPMTQALRVEVLGQEDQQAIAEQIASGEPARAIVKDYLEAAEPPDDVEEDPEGEHLEDADVFTVDDDSPESWYAYFVARFEVQVPEFEADPEALVGTAGDHQHSAEILACAAEFFARMSRLELDAADMADAEV